MSTENRFQGLTSNGPLPGGEEGRYLRQLQRTYGIDPVVGGETTGTTRSDRRRQQRGNKPEKDGHWENVGTHGTKKWVPNS